MGLPRGLRAVVTGGGSGLGRAFALEVARRGGKVVVSDIDEAGNAETVRLVKAAGGDAWAEQCDVREMDAMNELASQAEATELSWRGSISSRLEPRPSAQIDQRPPS